MIVTNVVVSVFLSLYEVLNVLLKAQTFAHLYTFCTPFAHLKARIKWFNDHILLFKCTY